MKDNKPHKSHCYQGEYEDSCKYLDENCPMKDTNKNKTIITLSYSIGEKSFTKNLNSFSEMDDWFIKYKEISEYKDFACFQIEVRNE